MLGTTSPSPDDAALDELDDEAIHEPWIDDQPMDAMSLLSRDIQKGPLLTAAQEIALARRMRGDDVSVSPPGEARPTPQRAHDRLVEQNMRLVLSIARKHQHRGLPVEDLVQEGALGLRRAAEKFDPDKGWRFSTYAVWWVRQSVSRALADQGRTVRVPVHMVGRLAQIARAEEGLRLRLGRRPTPVETAVALGLAPEQIDDARAATQVTTSLDLPINEDGAGTLGDLVAASDPSPEEVAEAGGVTDEVAAVLAKLPPRERLVIIVRFGIGRDQPGTLGDAGRALGVTRERARQIEAAAFRRLRDDPRLRALAE